MANFPPEGDLPPSTVSAIGPAVGPAVGPLGLILPTLPQNSDVVPSAHELAETSRKAESDGATALWGCDHLFWHRPLIECFTAVAIAAMATRNAVVGTCVVQLPLRNPADVAKQASSLQHISQGRLVLGVGIGVHPGEYEMAGADYHRRGATLSGSISAIRGHWDTADGDLHYKMLPKADQVPIWIGGSSEAAMRRTGKMADGWIPMFVDADQYGDAMERLDKEADHNGRDPSSITRAVVAFVSSTAAGGSEAGTNWMGSLYNLPPKAFGRRLVSGTAKECATSLGRWYEAGAEHIAVFVTNDRPGGFFADLAGELAELGYHEALDVAGSVESATRDISSGPGFPGDIEPKLAGSVTEVG